MATNTPNFDLPTLTLQQLFFVVRCGGNKFRDGAYFNEIMGLIHDPVVMTGFATYLKTRGTWAQVRTYWRARWIAVYWQAQTVEQLYAADGMGRMRDREAFEQDFA